jgi:hypothetical protein
MNFVLYLARVSVVSEFLMMSNTDMLKLTAPCGLYYGGCSLYRARSDKALAERMAQRMGVSADMVPICLSCRAQEGRIAVVAEPVCSTYNCAVSEKGLEFCYQCDEFPCLKLAPCVDRAQEIPHSSKVYNLLLLQKLGTKKWLQYGDMLWKQYWQGKKPRPGADIEV